MAESRFQWACGLASSWPHVLLPMKALSDWQGVDYATANNLIGKHGLALVAVGNDVGLLIGGGEIPMSTWVSSERTESGDIIIPLEWSDEAIDEAIVLVSRVTETHSLSRTHLGIRCDDGGFILLPAPETEHSPSYSAVHVPLARGRYAVWTGKVDKAGLLCRICRLSKVDA